MLRTINRQTQHETPTSPLSRMSGCGDKTLISFSDPLSPSLSLLVVKIDCGCINKKIHIFAVKGEEGGREPERNIYARQIHLTLLCFGDASSSWFNAENPKAEKKKLWVTPFRPIYIQGLLVSSMHSASPSEKKATVRSFCCACVVLSVVVLE